MAKFDVKRYGDNLIDYTLKAANKAVSNVDVSLIVAINNLAARVYDIQRVNAYWVNRTWNLLSSFFAVVLYDKKILGVQTAGAEFKPLATRKSVSSKSKKELPAIAKGSNPVFGSKFTNKGMAEWRSDDKEHYPFYGGFAYANKAIQTVISRTRKKGYVVIIGFGMPYATYNWPEYGVVQSGKQKGKLRVPMYVRTKGLIEQAIKEFTREIQSRMKGVTIKIAREYYKTTNTTR